MKRYHMVRLSADHEPEDMSAPNVSSQEASKRPFTDASSPSSRPVQRNARKVQGHLSELAQRQFPTQQHKPGALPRQTNAMSTQPTQLPRASSGSRSGVDSPTERMRSDGVGIDPSIFQNESKARPTIIRLFATNGGSSLPAAQALAASLLTPSSAGAPDCTRAVLVAYALEGACNGDPQRACAVLACWRGASSSKPAIFDAFATARRLAKSGPGFEALLAMADEPSGAAHCDRNSMISREAKRQALLLADSLITRVRANAQKHGLQLTEERAIELANGIVDAMERGAHSPWSAEPPIAEDVLMIARALACARRLASDPDAEPPVSWRSAYFAARSFDDKVHAGRDLGHVQESLAKFVDYARNAAHAVPQGRAHLGDWLERVFSSKRRSPLLPLREAALFDERLAALADYDPSQAIQAMIDHLRQLLVRDGADRGAPALTARRAIRIAALRYWQTRISSCGQNVVLRLGTQARNEIARDAEAILGNSPARAYVQRSTRLSELDRLGPDQLRTWATDEEFPVPRQTIFSQSAIMEWTRRMAHPREARNDAREAGATQPRAVVEGLGRVAANLPEGATAVFGDGSVHGPTTYVKLTGRLPLPVLHHHLPPELWPIGAVCGEVLAEKERHALVELSRSDAHETALAIVASSSDSAAFGAGGFIQVEPTLSESYVAGQLDIVPTWRRRRGAVFHMTDAGRSTDENVRLVIEALASASAVDEPTNAAAVWNRVAASLYKEPGISVGWLKEDAMGAGIDARVNATARVIPLSSAAPVFHVMGGTMGEARVSAGIERLNRKESGAAGAASDNGIQTRASAATAQTPVAALPNIELQGTVPLIGPSVRSLSFSSARLSSARPFDRLASESTWAARKGSTHTRIVTSAEEIDMRRSVREAEATDVGALLRAIDAWRTMDAHDGIPSREQIAEQLSGQPTGAAMYICRQRLVPSVAKQIDALRALSATLAGNGGAIPDSTRADLLKSAEHRIEALQTRNDSWAFDGVYVRSAPQTWGEPVGPKWLFRAQTQTFFSLKEEHKVTGP